MVKLSDLPENLSNWTRHNLNREHVQCVQYSIQDWGIETPIELLQMDDGSYKIRSGCVRIQACRNLGMPMIPAYILTRKDICEFYHFLFD